MSSKSPGEKEEEESNGKGTIFTYNVLYNILYNVLFII